MRDHPFIAAAQPLGQVDDEVHAAVARVRGLLAELITLWPKAEARHIVLWVRSNGEQTGAGARMRAHVMAEGDDIAPRVKRIRNDVPVVVELDGRRPIVAPLRSLGAR
jgi:hypothetical protein